MKCEQIRENLAAYMEGLLEKETSIKIQEHINTCEACREALHQEKLLFQRLKKSGQAFSVPRMEKAVMNRVLLRQRRPRIFHRFLAASAAIYIAAITIVLIKGFEATSPEPEQHQQIAVVSGPPINDWVLLDSKTPPSRRTSNVTQLDPQILARIESLGYTKGPVFVPSPPQITLKNSAQYMHVSKQQLGIPVLGDQPQIGFGFSTGGAKDILNFRENIEKGYLPLPTDITCEGLFYDYYFDTGDAYRCDDLFYPSYASAKTRDPFSGKEEYYLTVGLNSGMKGFKRKQLNLVIVLDVSGSMDSPFDRYHYDPDLSEEENKEERKKKKIDLAKESLMGLLDRLEKTDRFGMVVFSDQARLAKPLRYVGETDMPRIREHILNLGAKGSTNMDAGIRLGSSLFDAFSQTDPDAVENRIIFLTDAMPNRGDISEAGLMGKVKGNGDQGIFFSFVGIGIDFNSTLVEAVTKTRGANYVSVHNSGSFKKRMTEEFDFMVTPLVFDLKLVLESGGYAIEKVLGSPEADLATGTLMKVNTLFPSPRKEKETRGGVVLLKLKRKPEPSEEEIFLAVRYKDRSGKSYTSSRTIRFQEKKADSYDNQGIRKAVLLSRYACLMQNWLMDERRDEITRNDRMAVHGFDFEDKDCLILPEEGISYPPQPLTVPGVWERISRPLTVKPQYKDLFLRFLPYFEKEMKAIGDASLKQEADLLKQLD